MARPEKYTEQYCVELGQRLLEWMAADESHLFVQEFCLQEGLGRQRISELVKKWDSFSDIIKRAQELQEMRLAKLAVVSGKPIGPIFLLKAKHGYTEKIEVKTDNIHRNLSTKQLAEATEAELRDIMRSLTDDATAD